MRQRFAERDAIVRPTGGPGEAGARGRECLEAELLEENRAAAIPGIRDDEAARLVELVKAVGLFGHGSQTVCAGAASAREGIRERRGTDCDRNAGGATADDVVEPVF